MDDSYETDHHLSKKSINEFPKESITTESKNKKASENLSNDLLDVKPKDINKSSLINIEEEKRQNLHEIVGDLRTEQMPSIEISESSVSENANSKKEGKGENVKINELHEKLDQPEEEIHNIEMRSLSSIIDNPKMVDIVQADPTQKVEIIKHEKISENSKVNSEDPNSKLEKNSESNNEKQSQDCSSDLISSIRESKEEIPRHQSDIFSLKAIPTNLLTSIFSVNGTPSRKLFKKDEKLGDPISASIQEESAIKQITKKQELTKIDNDKERSCNSPRNPLTGSGVSSNDEYKKNDNAIRKKDGNPLLGTGYESEVSNNVSKNRIPPGGFSHKLW